MTSVARYSLLSMRPDAERIDVLCVGALVLGPNKQWRVFIPGKEKLEALGYIAASRRLMAMGTNLLSSLESCESMSDARVMLAQMRSTLSVHEFEGLFTFDSDGDFSRHVSAITLESVAMPPSPLEEETTPRVRPVRQLVRTRLRRHFSEMGILAARGTTDANHMVVPNYPLSAKHGLTAEFALKNSVWHITETVDFAVAAEGLRNKTFEAQAKCLVLRAAHDILGKDTKRYIVIHGGESAHASSSVDLLSTVGQLYMTESDEDMTNYLDLIAKAAGSTKQLRADLGSLSS